MTRKGYAKLQRLRNAKQAWSTAASFDARGDQRRIIERFNASLSASDTTLHTEDSDAMESQPRPADAKAYNLPVPANHAIVAAAFYRATTGAIRRQLKGDACLALIILVPRASWIEPVKSFFLRRFGTHWHVLDIRTTLSEKRESNSYVAKCLTNGLPVVGVAADRDAFPSTLIAAADLVVGLNELDGAAFRVAVRMAVGKRLPGRVSDTIAAGFEFQDLVAAFRSGSSPGEIISRLTRAREATHAAAPAERLPSLEDAVEYGDARSWGLTLARDLADFRAGRLTWENVDHGAVLYSEPGLGKSLFARILAQACEAPLLTYSISDLFANSRGDLDGVVKASRAMFERAAAFAPTPCILFLDEIDALPNRLTMSSRAQEWWTTLVTDFLLSLDNAVAGKRAGIVVIGATNNIEGVDPALLRPGRLERSIKIKRPDRAGILNILKYHLNGELLKEDLSEVANVMEGCTGAEIMMAVRGARRAARYQGRDLECNDLLTAIAPVDDIPADILRRICVHEAAHAVSSVAVRSGVLIRCFVGGMDSSSGGGTVIRRDARSLLTKVEIERQVIVALSGRAAEEMLLGDASNGAGGDCRSDLARATRLIGALHAAWGLGDTISYVAAEDDVLAAVALHGSLRDKVEKHLLALQTEAREVVNRHRGAIIAVSDQLQRRRVLTGGEIVRILEAASPKFVDPC